MTDHTETWRSHAPREPLPIPGTQPPNRAPFFLAAGAITAAVTSAAIAGLWWLSGRSLAPHYQQACNLRRAVSELAIAAAGAKPTTLQIDCAAQAAAAVDSLLPFQLSAALCLVALITASVLYIIAGYVVARPWENRWRRRFALAAATAAGATTASGIALAFAIAQAGQVVYLP